MSIFSLGSDDIMLPMLALLLVLVAVLYIYHTEEQTGGLPQVTISNKYNEPYYGRHYRELDDVHNVLARPLRQGKPHIQQLRSVGISADSRPAQLQKAPVTYLDLEAGEYITDPTPKSILTLVEGRQPSFFNESVVIDYCGRKFYWDWRYPEQPLPVEFAQDPEGYLRRHPNEYPAPLVASRNLSQVKPYDPSG